MKSKKIETVMTYDQWCVLMKKRAKRKILDYAKRKINTVFNWIVISLMFLVLPIGMILHWLIIGY